MYAFSLQNFHRPPAEVDDFMRLLEDALVARWCDMHALVRGDAQGQPLGALGVRRARAGRLSSTRLQLSPAPVQRLTVPAQGVRLRFIGDRQRLPASLAAAMDR